MASLEHVEHLRIALEDIKVATNNFDRQNFIAKGGFGSVYKGKLSHLGTPMDVAVKRLDPMSQQGEREFLTEISMLVNYRHDNLVSLIGFCEDADERILVYEYAVHGSLDKYVSNSDNLTWEQRLKICIDAAHGLNHLHSCIGSHHRVIHRDVKSANILLFENWKAKLSDFGMSKIGPANQAISFLISNPMGTLGYCDPEYRESGILTKESDVYSFGVVMFEILSGRLALVQNYNDERRLLVNFVQHCFAQQTPSKIIDENLKEQIDPYSVTTFLAIAYQCLRKRPKRRPTMDMVIRELQIALEFQGRKSLLADLHPTYMDIEKLINNSFQLKTASRSSTPQSSPPSYSNTLQYSENGTSAPVQLDAPTTWSTGLYGCSSDVLNCCLTCCCPCIIFGQIAEIIDQGTTSCGKHTALYLITVVTCCCFIYSCVYRWKMRRQYLLPGSCCDDFLLNLFCQPCALCQEYRELQHHGFDMLIGWQGNLERQSRGIVMPPRVPQRMNR